MSKILKFSLVLCSCVGLVQCTNNATLLAGGTARELTMEEKHLAESGNTFGLELFKKIVEEEESKNVFISPLGVSMALGMTYNGADGTTEEAMQKTLGLNGLTLEEVNESYRSLIELLTELDPKVRFRTANSIWYRQNWSLKNEFITLCRRYFNALVRGLDFNDPDAPAVINLWVDENTNGKIREIVGSINPMAVMFLINAIYFKGIWTYQFDESLTRDDWFTLPDGSRKDCRMMKQEGDLRYFEGPDFQAVDLPYGDGDFSMTIFLPHPRRSVDSLIGEFDLENWVRWMDSFSEHRGTLHLPKFTLKYELSLNEVLKALGMGVAFDPYGADFTRMCEAADGFYISEVKHKTFVEVNEEGTEAAAVTSVEMRITSEGFSIRIDRPFAFVIRENQSRTILFIGKIVDPTLE